jgi:uncharacterized membrane protein HdeD (DUF308 family)
MQALRTIYPGKLLLMLIQALLMIFMGIVFFIKADKKAEDLQTLMAVSSMLIGGLSVLGYFGVSPFDKSIWELSMGLLSFAGALILLFEYKLEPGLFPLLFSVLILLHALLYANAYSYARQKAVFRWLIFPLLGNTLFIIYVIITGEAFLAESILLLAGLQYIFCGITTSIFAKVTYNLQIEFSKPISDFGPGNLIFKGSTK